MLANDRRREVVSRRVVIIDRPTEYEELLVEHGTRRNVEFFLDQRGESLEPIDERHAAQKTALATISAGVPSEWRRSSVPRADLDRWLFEPDDVVVTVGPDGLVANVAKYLDGHLVIGTNPQGAGPLARVVVDEVDQRFSQIERYGSEAMVSSVRAMVEVTTDDGRSLRALNDVFIGSGGHQSARYELIEPGGVREAQSSSGLVVGTGTGSTGWCMSLWNDRRPGWQLPLADERLLCWFVREAWPSPITGAEQTNGVFAPGEELVVTARSEGLVVFGDGMEQDRLELRWGQSVSVAIAETSLRLAA